VGPTADPDVVAMISTPAIAGNRTPNVRPVEYGAGGFALTFF
jgi:hypothetical protein